MNVLLVDDQKEIVESLKKGIRWKEIAVSKVYTACSAKEAKLVLANFPVDVLITDIEMPEENGISLCRWLREHFSCVECIFLTSHADFQYAQEAIQMGGFDYVLQPVRYSEVEEVIKRVQVRISGKKKIQKIEDTRKAVIEQRNTILDAMLEKMLRQKEEDANRIFSHFTDMLRMEFDYCIIFPILVQVTKWKKITNIWEEGLLRMTFCNILEELFLDQGAKVGIGLSEDTDYWMFLAVEKTEINKDLWQIGLEKFYHFIDEKMDFQVGIFPMLDIEEMDFSDMYEKLTTRSMQNKQKRPGIYWEDLVVRESVKAADENPVDQAVLYIKENLSKNILRTDVAEMVHLNEEYFSRLFKQETGSTFKDFVVMEKMKLAQSLLSKSRLSVSIIASKVGYDNFSHFSKMFKKVTGRTPQEYRKDFS